MIVLGILLVGKMAGNAGLQQLLQLIGRPDINPGQILIRMSAIELA
jgi:hypothetical protein